MSRRSELRHAAESAGLPQMPFLVLDVLLLFAGKDADAVQVSWRRLQAKCGGMSEKTLSRALGHLERHAWITRTRLSGQGRPVLYGLQLGEQCECRQGRGQPMTPAERQARSRARRKDVTLDAGKDVTLNGGKEILCHGH